MVIRFGFYITSHNASDLDMFSVPINVLSWMFLGSNLMLELDSVLYVGGVPKDMYTSLPVGVLSRQGFEGCISSLDLPGESPSLLEDAVVPSSSLGSGCEGI